MESLNAKAWTALAALVGVMAVLLFVPAGTTDYWHAWAYLSIFFGASFLNTLYLVKRDRALLLRRMRGGPMAEKQASQRIIMSFNWVGFIGLLVVPAVDFRLRWSAVPFYGIVAGHLLVAVGLLVVFLVFRVNTFASATIEVAADQKVISTGPYAVVRHPMYAGASLYLLGTPLALGSYWGFLASLGAMLPVLIWRLLEEERLLGRSLPKYTEYQKQVPHRLVPGIW
jgi:protein-S-isoprenylcysteine O-methyltransferase Ste14